MNLFRSLFLFLFFLFSLSATPSAAQGPATPSLATGTISGSNSTSSTSVTPNSTAPTTTFVNLTTTDAQGSTIITSVPTTIPGTNPTTTSSTPYPSLTGYPTCVTNCLTDSVALVNCDSITNVTCYCPNQTFPNTLYACVAANCSSNVLSAENLAKQFCALDNVTLSFASTAAPSTMSLSTQSATSSSTSSTSSKPFNAAPSAPWIPDARGWTGMALAACGAVFGAALL